MNQLTMEREFLKRDEYDQALYLAPLTDRERVFLQLMYDIAVGAVTIDGRGIRRHDTLWLRSEQDVLASELGYKDGRTIRDIAKGLEDRMPQLFKRCKKTIDGRVHTAYVLNLAKLRSMTELDPDDPLDAMIIDCDGDPFGDAETVSHPELSTADPPSSGGSSAASSGGSSGRSSGPHGSMDHGQHNKQNTMEPWTMDHGVLNFDSWGWGKGRLTDDDVRRLVAEEHLAAFEFMDSEGLRLWSELPADKRGGWVASDVRRNDRAALWHYAATAPGVDTPAGLLKTKLRTGDFKGLRDLDRDWARQFLRKNAAPSPAIALPSLSLDPKDVAAAEYFAEPSR